MSRYDFTNSYRDIRRVYQTLQSTVKLADGTEITMGKLIGTMASLALVTIAVADWFGDGLTIGEIAQRIGRSESAVRDTVTELRQMGLLDRKMSDRRYRYVLSATVGGPPVAGHF